MRTIYVYNPETRGYDPVEFTEEVALSLHRQMWTDMQKKLGDNPSHGARAAFKDEWCRKHIEDPVRNDCFLCHYATDEDRDLNCDECPIVWPGESSGAMGFFCEFGERGQWHTDMPISELLALPERSRDV